MHQMSCSLIGYDLSTYNFDVLTTTHLSKVLIVSGLFPTILFALDVCYFEFGSYWAVLESNLVLECMIP